MKKILQYVWPGASRVRCVVPAIALALAVACAPPPRPGRLYVERRPPPVRYEVLGVAPSRSAVWVGGYWRWERGDYAWVPGRWEVPGAGFRSWSPSRWAYDRRGWYFIDGHWRR